MYRPKTGWFISQKLSTHPSGSTSFLKMKCNYLVLSFTNVGQIRGKKGARTTPGVSGWMVRPPDVPDGQNCLGNFGRCQAIGCVDSFWEINHPVLGLYIAINYKFKFKFFINKESTIRNMHIWKNAQMTRTNKRIKQGNTRKIKNNNTGVSGWMVRPPDVPDGQNCLGNLFRFGTLSLGYLFRCQAIWADLLLHLLASTKQCSEISYKWI
jgi:hypothetical protein